MWVLLGVLFLISGIIYLIREIRYIRMQNDLLIISFVRLLFACSCGFFAAIICLVYGLNGVKINLGNLVVLNYDSETLYNFYVFWFCSVITYLSMSLGYRCLGNKRIRFTVSNKKVRFSRNEISDNQIFVVSIICMIIGIIGILVWTSDIGGIVKFIKLASALRGDYTNVYGNTHMAYRQIAKFLLPSTYMFYFLTLKNKKKKLYKLSFIVSLIFSILYLLCNDGRLTTVLFFMILFVGYFRYGDKRTEDIKKQITKFSLILIVAFVLLAKADDISYYIRHQEVNTSVNENSVFITLISEFSYIYKSGTTAVENCFPAGKLMLGDDILFGIGAYLPLGNLMGEHLQVSRYNTMLCTNNKYNLAGAIPCDLVALSLYDLGYLGILIIPFLMGLLIRYVENCFIGKKNNPFQQTLYFGAVLIFIRQVTYCEVYDLLTISMPYLVIWIMSKFIMLCKSKR